MEEALSYLKELIDSGYEYPDAEWKTANLFKVSCWKLRQAYDRAD